ncbi:metallophosphoesterase [Synechococcus sp. LTW-R]|uniref:metallophosphoesterase n=1 Tax=Synechococcus sp. LTW-R TaxID=2751170 RepID=UPI00162AB2F0|nr:metallophosphoesterase [Synechococcus sp. LTW-R]QNG30560.1 metallophosphoesterase [Synechococcus sp. LTW-R]
MTSVSRKARHWVIGDVHGCSGSLEQLLAQLPAGDRLIFCGDAINRGPDTPATMERIWGLVDSGRAIWLRGNHEQDLIDALRSAPGSSGGAGAETRRQLGPEGCALWLKRLEQLPLAYWGESWVATHAGFNPSTWQPDLRVRMGFWEQYDGRFGDVVIGHTPGPNVRRLPNIVMVDTGACYGGDLSAYCPESREVVSVPGLAHNLQSPSLSPV